MYQDLFKKEKNKKHEYALKIFLRKIKIKNENMTKNDIKIFLKMKN